MRLVIKDKGAARLLMNNHQYFELSEGYFLLFK